MESNTQNATPNKYQELWTHSPFIMKDDRNTYISCPSCKDGYLQIRYSPKGGVFACECGFVLK